MYGFGDAPISGPSAFAAPMAISDTKFGGATPICQPRSAEDTLSILSKSPMNAHGLWDCSEPETTNDIGRPEKPVPSPTPTKAVGFVVARAASRTVPVPS